MSSVQHWLDWCKFVDVPTLKKLNHSNANYTVIKKKKNLSVCVRLRLFRYLDVPKMLLESDKQLWNVPVLKKNEIKLFPSGISVSEIQIFAINFYSY